MLSSNEGLPFVSLASRLFLIAHISNTGTGFDLQIPHQRLLQFYCQNEIDIHPRLGPHDKQSIHGHGASFQNLHNFGVSQARFRSRFSIAIYQWERTFSGFSDHGLFPSRCIPYLWRPGLAFLLSYSDGILFFCLCIIFLDARLFISRASG